MALDPTLQWVAVYRDLGWATVRIPPLSKAPLDKAWPDLDYPPQCFAPGDNIGVKLGLPSGGLTDVDLDCPEAVALAPMYLQPTAIFGRTGPGKTPGKAIDWAHVSNARHFLYRCATKTKKPTQTHVEIRSTGLQTVFPGSIHESGVPIEWISWVNPREISELELHATVGKLGFAVVLARVWGQLGGVKHQAVLALAGALWHAGWTMEDALHVLLPAMELDGTREPHREAAIRGTWDDGDKLRTGWPSVESMIGALDTAALKRCAEMVQTVPRGQLERAATDDALELHDVGNTERFMREHGEDLRYVQGIGWLQWSGATWGEQSPISLIIRSIRSLERRGKETRDPSVLKWANASMSHGHISAVESIAAKVDKRTTGLDLDANHWLLNCSNAVVDLRTGLVQAHRREDLITKTAGTEYDPSATAPRFLQFMHEVFAGDQQLVNYMLRYLGYALTGEVREQVFQVWHGHGSNGKSTLIELLLHVLGDYGQRMADDLLVAKRFGKDSAAPSPDVARMRGARFSVGSEAGEGLRWNEPLVKQLTGADRVVARHLRKEHVEFDPTWKIALAVNHKPIVRGTDHGIWRRIHLVPFEVRFSGGGLDPLLLHKLKSESPGVLALLVRGCLEWQQKGLAAPRRVVAAVQDYRAEHDVIGTFLAECTIKHERSVVSKGELYRVFRAWATANGEFAHGRQAFGRIIAERGLVESTNGETWIEVALKTQGF